MTDFINHIRAEQQQRERVRKVNKWFAIGALACGVLFVSAAIFDATNPNRYSSDGTTRAMQRFERQQELLHCQRTARGLADCSDLYNRWLGKR